jgi:ABC-type lipoprotein release transport system permease subunit
MEKFPPAHWLLAAASAAVPVWRATRIDPVTILRDE